MTGRHWFRKDVLMPVFYVFVFGAGLYLLYRELAKVPAMVSSHFVQLAFRLLMIIYILLVVITIHHIFSTYDLERYDPGDPTSLKRLLRRHRFHLTRKSLGGESLLLAIEQSLFADHYRLEAESHLIGRIYRRHHTSWIPFFSYYDRVFIMQHEPLNILLVDQLLQDCIHFLQGQKEKPSRRNCLIMISRMEDPNDVASAAAGIVNFLGKFQGGTLCPFFLAINQHRLFFPADRTLMPRTHRLFQDRFRFRLLRVIHETAKGRKQIKTERIPDDISGVAE
jgi:hypothetical protein